MVREKKVRGPKASSIWDDPRYQKILEEPVGISQLSDDEIDAIIRAGFGRRPHLPPGAEYVHSLRSIWRGLAKKSG